MYTSLAIVLRCLIACTVPLILSISYRCVDTLRETLYIEKFSHNGTNKTPQAISNLIEL